MEPISESRIFVCASNKSRKVCENEDLPLDVVDLITIKVVNRIIVNKHNFIRLLEESFEEKNNVIYKQQEIESIMDQINELQAKFNKYKDIDDEFYREVNKAYEQKLKPLYKKKVMLENEISTATGVNDYLYQFKKAIMPLTKTITSLEDIPLNKIFSKVIIHDRDHITFVLGTCKSISDIKNMDKDILVEQEPYYIRKTKHNLKFEIYIN